LLSVGDPNVLLGSVKPSEEGIENGLITRFWNVHSEPISTSLKLVRPIKNAWQTTHIETDLDQIKPSEDSLKLSFRQSEMKTYRLQLK
jgi:alpha-mannosidase